MSSLHEFTFEKGLKEMFSQTRRSVGRVPLVRKRKLGLGPFNVKKKKINKGARDQMEWTTAHF